MNSSHQRFNIVKHDSTTGQETVVSRSGRAWVGTEKAAEVEALRLAAALAATDATPHRWSYKAVPEARR